MNETTAPALITTDWLAQHLDDPDVRVVDGSFHIPGSGRDQAAEYACCHIPGARFFDINGICDPDTDLPHMLPTPEGFAAAVGALGIGNRHHVVVYDAPGSCAAPRVWWTFRIFGHDRVSVLDGGLAKWLAEGRPVEERPVTATPEVFTAGFRPHLVRSAEEIMRDLGTATAPQIVDNRPAARFSGEVPEPRPAKHQGHIPGAISIPFSAYLDPARPGCWRTPDDLRKVFADAGIDPAGPLVASCGSGVTAATTAFAAFLLGHDGVAVYDGSWAEWGNRDDVPVER